MTAYIGGNKIKDTGEYGVYLGSPNTNCLTYTPKNINLTLSNGTLTLKKGSKVYVPNGFDDVKYYKYTYSSWTQPVLSANGTLGGDSFAVTESGSYNDSNPAYRVFDSDTSTHCIFDKSSGYLMFYNPNPLKVTKLTITNAKGDSWGTRALTAGTVYGSNNGTAFNKIKDFTNSTTGGSASWSIDMSANTQGYKYYKIIVTDTSYSNSGAASQCMVSNLAITATQQTGSVESTADDYDYTVGSGQMKFDEVVIESDIVASNYTGYTYTALACYVPELNKVLLNDVYTGSGNGFDYNVQENYLRLAGDWSDTTWTGKLTTLPLGLIEMTSAVGVTSINQIFDWRGYIGSTDFVLPNVEGLGSYGFNADGTYRNVKFKTTKVLITTDVSGATGDLEHCLMFNASGVVTSINRLNLGTYVYDKDKNYWYHSTTNVQTRLVIIDRAYRTNGQATSLTPYTAQPEMTLIPFNAIYNGSDKVYQYLPSPTTFNAGSNLVTYTVPKGCTKLEIDCVASKGADGTKTGGNGGRVQCNLSVTPGQVLYVTVGDIPATGVTASYNASDIRTNNAGVTDTTSLQSRLLVAGGGGNSGVGSGIVGGGGAGGGLTGANGADGDMSNGGKGGSQTAGGAGGGFSGFGTSGKAGGLGIGGNGTNDMGDGGAGGAGYYGGGGGGHGHYYGGDNAGGGGGGSSYTSSACSNVVHTQGYQNGAGYITITPKG